MCGLRKLIGENDGLPIESMRLILQGNVLHDKSNNGEDVSLHLNDGGISLCLCICVLLTKNLSSY